MPLWHVIFNNNAIFGYNFFLCTLPPSWVQNIWKTAGLNSELEVKYATLEKLTDEFKAWVSYLVLFEPYYNEIKSRSISFCLSAAVFHLISTKSSKCFVFSHEKKLFFPQTNFMLYDRKVQNKLDPKWHKKGIYVGISWPDEVPGAGRCFLNVYWIKLPINEVLGNKKSNVPTTREYMELANISVVDFDPL